MTGSGKAPALQIPAHSCSVTSSNLMARPVALLGAEARSGIVEDRARPEMVKESDRIGLGKSPPVRFF